MELETFLAGLGRALARITLMAAPFMPTKTDIVWQALGLDGKVTQATWSDLQTPTVSGRTVSKLAPLFPKA